MATTKIWDIQDSLARVVDYAENPDKTANPSYIEQEIQGLYDVMNYATNESKTEMQYYVSGVNCMLEIARRQMNKYDQTPVWQRGWYRGFSRLPEFQAG